MKAQNVSLKIILQTKEYLDKAVAVLRLEINGISDRALYLY